MTKDNLKLDYENRMVENEERRRAHLAKIAKKEQLDLRKKNAEENKANRDEEAKTKFLTNEQKRE